MSKRRFAWATQLRAARDLLAAEEGGLDHAYRTIARWLANERAGNGHGPRTPQPVSRKRLRRERRLAVFERDGYRCRMCGSQRELTIHHEVAISAGGKHDEGNLVTLCRDCHDRVEMRRDLLRVLRSRCGVLVAVDPTPRPSGNPIHQQRGYRGRVMRAEQARGNDEGERWHG